MVDNIKIRLAHSGIREEYGVAKKGKNSSKYNRRFSIPSHVPNGEELTMQVCYYAHLDKTVIDILGSWRKWYLGSGSTGDLTYANMQSCIGDIALKIGLPIEKIQNAKILNVEVGFNLRFRENMGDIINGFVYYKGFDKIYEYGRESVKFKGDAYSVSCYDKFSEIMNVSERAKKKSEQKLIRKGEFPEPRKSKTLLSKKMNKNNFCLRFEVKVVEIQKALPELKGRINCPICIMQNWNEILDGLDKIFEKVDFAEYNLNVGREFLEKKGMNELNKYKTHVMAILAGGIREYISLFVAPLNSRHRNDYLAKEMQILNFPPPELRKALKGCRLKKELLYETKDKRINGLKRTSLQ